jgi:hypothetical protein
MPKIACLLLFGVAVSAGAQAPSAVGRVAATQAALEISLEKKLADGTVQAVASDHVFEPGDLVHFRVKSEFDGYLYVMDQGTSGKFATVFPSEDAGADNRVRQTQMFSIPSGESSWFEISGPEGFDVVYFLLSPTPLATPAAAAFAAPAPVSSLKPRCNDEVFKARGECTDMNAGPAPVPKGAALPAPIAPLAGLASRDIKVVKKQDTVTVGGTGNKTAPVIYTFRLAHH